MRGLKKWAKMSSSVALYRIIDQSGIEVQAKNGEKIEIQYVGASDLLLLAPKSKRTQGINRRDDLLPFYLTK